MVGFGTYIYIYLHSTTCFYPTQAYEWALNSTKFVQSITMDGSATPEHISKLQRSLSLYLQDNPAISGEVFDLMINLALKLQNEKLKVCRC